MSSKASKIIRGSSWQLIMSWYTKLLGVFSMIILARYLDKEDFGVIAACFIVQGFFTAISNVGSNQFLVRKKSISDQDLNVAWTINFVTKLIIAIAVFALSGPLADFMQVESLSSALKVMSLSAIFIGAINPAVSKYIKQLDFSKELTMEFIAKTVSSSTSIAIAIIYQSYWAVVFGEVIYQFLRALVSHIIIDFRPRFTKENTVEQWNFSKWVLVKGIVSYFKFTFDRLIVSKSYALGELGLYTFAAQSSSTALKVLINPIDKVFYPGLSDYLGNHEELVDKVYKYVTPVVFIYMPIVVGGICLSELIVPLVFGEKWREACGLFDIFLSMTLARVLITAFSKLFTLIGEVRFQYYYELVTTIASVLFIFSISSLPLESFAMGRVALSYILVLTLVLTINRFIPVSVVRLFSLMLPAIASASVMALVLSYFDHSFDGNSPLVRLLGLIACGAVVYAVSLISIIVLLKSKIPVYNFIFRTFILKIYTKLSHRSSIETNKC